MCRRSDSSSENNSSCCNKPDASFMGYTHPLPKWGEEVKHFRKISAGEGQKILILEGTCIIRVLKAQKCFLLHLKSSFRSQDINFFSLTFWSCRKVPCLER